MKINILGHEYTVLHLTEENIPEDLKAKMEDANGLCENFSNELIIYHHDPAPKNYRRLDLLEKKVGTHELIHGYFYKSGIHQLMTTEAQEAVVDMLAINLEKIYENAIKVAAYIELTK